MENNWTIDREKMIVTHSGGLTVQFEVQDGGELIGRPIAGLKNYKFDKVLPLMRMAGEFFEGKFKSNLT